MPLLSALVAATVLAQPQIAPQRKQTLPNGVSLFAERVERAGVFALHFSVTALGEPEPQGQRGYRHLIEHLVARGRKGDLDARLESRGLFLTADTVQDGVRFEIEGASEQVEFAIAQLAELLEFPSLTKEEIAKEVTVIKEEQGVRSTAARLFAALYETAFKSPDPLGEFQDLATATPESLKSSYTNLFVPGRMSVAVVGEVDPTKVMAALSAVFSPLNGAARPPTRLRAVVPPLTEGFVKDAPGCGRAVPVGSLSQPETVAVVAAALALASEINGAQVMYLPSPLGGLVAIVHPSRTGLDDADRLITNEAARLFKNGRTSVRRWAETTDASVREKARTYGHMLLLENFFRMEDHLRRTNELQQADFVAALQQFYSRTCVKVGGVR